jgi:hypothetical protein
MNNCQVRVRQTVPMSEIAFDAERRRLTVGAWSARATWVRSSPRTGADGEWSAVLGVRSGVNVLVNADQAAQAVWVELWAGEPEESDGLAVTTDGDTLIGVARIPLCGCGDRGCGNVGIQLATTLAADDLPALVETLRATPDVSAIPRIPRKVHTWRGEFAGGYPVVV